MLFIIRLVIFLSILMMIGGFSLLIWSTAMINSENKWLYLGLAILITLGGVIVTTIKAVLGIGAIAVGVKIGNEMSNK